MGQNRQTADSHSDSDRGRPEDSYSFQNRRTFIPPGEQPPARCEGHSALLEGAKCNPSEASADNVEINTNIWFSQHNSWFLLLF